ncbi:MAG: VacJ family lipoprotein [Pseudomonadota bacterium]
MFTLNARVLLLVLFGLCSGCASLEGPEYGEYDQAEGLNRISYNAFDWVDRKAFAPVARGYQKVTPGFVRAGVTNAFTNLRTIDSSINGFLQGKVRKGSTDFARVLINSTLGIGGLFDVAKRMGLNYGSEDLGQTFGVYGYARTNYVFLPLGGPSAVRDLPGRLIVTVLPRLILGSAYSWPVGVLDAINGRANILVLTDARDDSALDPYVFTRDAYFQGRSFAIFDGDPPLDDTFDADFDDDEF